MSQKNNKSAIDKSSNLYFIRHSAAHILAQATKRLFGNVKFGVGPVTENGFFQDMLVTEGTIKESDLEKIEAEMRQIIAEDLPIEGKRYTRSEALEIMKDDPLKIDLINKFEGDSFGIYSQGEFFTLCEGNHTKRTSEVQFFKLQSIAGVYWQGKRENVQLQRVSGIAFETQAELDAYLLRLELAKKFDHRLIGKEQNLFSFLPEAPGIPFFYPKGWTVFNLLVEMCRKLLKKYGYQEIRTPQMLKEDLWHQSGHYENYKENMFFCKTQDESFCFKPMNCPGAILTYQNGLHSYRDLPMRLAEFGAVHRFELSGALHGLFRVRAFTQDDAHVFCTLDQVKEEIRRMILFCKELYEPFGFPEISYVVSTRPEKSIGTEQDWIVATSALIDVLNEEKIDFSINEGDGAFYGPKIDIYIKDSLDRSWQCGTIQVDYNQPERFKINYVAADQSRIRPVMIHRAIFGSLERFMAICIEHFRGKFPLWLSPVQVRVLTITEKQAGYGETVLAALLAAGVRAEADYSNETVSAKIRLANSEKIPMMVVLGAKECEAGTVTVRLADGTQQPNLLMQDLIALFQK